MTESLPAAPAHLSSSARKLWKSVVARHRLADEHLAALGLTLTALDRADAARKILDDDGLTIEGAHGGLTAHPAVGIERDARTAVLRGLRQLGLDLFENAAPQSREQDGRFGAQTK